MEALSNTETEVRWLANVKKLGVSLHVIMVDSTGYFNAVNIKYTCINRLAQLWED